MYGSPGSMTMYSTAKRNGMLDTDDKQAGPADYTVSVGVIKKRPETVAPFDTTAERFAYKYSFLPGPAAYLPDKLGRDCRGSPILRPDNFPAAFRRGYRSVGPGPAYRPTDALTKMTQDAKLMYTKRPRVNFEKFVSNCVPSVFHPQDIRCFVQGLDGRMYPWRISRENRDPGPKYNTFGIQTSHSKKNPPTDFSRNSKRPALFKVEPGFGPADFSIPRSLSGKGGIMLSQTDNPRKSDSRYFDILARKTIKDKVPHPFAYSIRSSFDKTCSKAVTAPFKSKTKLGGGIQAKDGPGPAAHFKVNVPFESVSDPKICGITTTPPDSSIKAFDTTEPRFFTTALNEQMYRPDPCAYTIRGFAEEIQYNGKRHKAAIKNPKLGFLISSEARPDSVFRKLFGSQIFVSTTSPRKPWKNMTPKRGQTYSYHGQPPKYPNSPGPIYDTKPGYNAIKGKKTWNDPRRWLHDTAFLVSGCCREIKLGHIDKDIPGTGKYYPKLPAASGGKLSTGQQRFPKVDSVGPGPSHKFHEKTNSSVWRASHLGTFNSKLKQIGISHPSSGGFHAKNLNKAADKAWRIDRVDDYEQLLTNPLQEKCMAQVMKVSSSTKC